MKAQDLRYDIIHQIVAQLKTVLRPSAYSMIKVKLAPYAAICKSWNPAIERETFRELYLSPESLGRAEELLNKDAFRCSAVRRIVFVGTYERSERPRRDLSERQLRARDRAFSTDVESLFRFLARAERRGGEGQGVARLDLQLRAVLDEVLPDEGYENSDDDSDWGEDREWDGSVRFRYDPAQVRYVGHELPKVRCVRLFELTDWKPRWGSSVTEVIAAMEGLEDCDVQFHDEQRVIQAVRVDYRKALGESLCQIPRTCRVFQAGFDNLTVEDDHDVPQPGFVPTSLDSLCIGLRDLSIRLVGMSLDLLAISPALFWPHEDERCAAKPYWPKLEWISVRCPPVDAAGKWLTHQSPDRAQPEHLNSLYVAVGKAIPNMPALQDIEMEPFHRHTSGASHFIYQYDKKQKAFLATWKTHGPLRLSPEVLWAFSIGERDLELSPGGDSGKAYIGRS